MLAIIAFWTSIGLVLYAYLGYPAALMLLSLLRRRPVRREHQPLTVSFIIAVHNEEQAIRAKIENTLSQTYPCDRFEIIVASDGSSDLTEATVRSFAPRVRLVRTLEHCGKEAAQALAVRSASGEILIFSDVASRLDPQAVQTFVANFADPSVGCVSSVDRFVDANGHISGEGTYVKYEMFLRSLESRTNGLVGLSGSCFAARRRVCEQWNAARQSDFNTLLNAVRLGLRGVQDAAIPCCYPNLADERHELSRKIRTVVRGIAVVASNLDLLNPFRFGLFSWQLLSHKLCRWLVPFAMLGAFVANLVALNQSLVYAGLFGLQLLFYLVAIVGLQTGYPRLRVPAYLLVANVAVLVAWLRLARGDRILSWTPSERLSA